MPISDQYEANQGGFAFLDGLRHEERIYGIKAHYQPLRDVFFDAKAQFHTLTDEAEMLHRITTNDLSFSFRLLWGCGELVRGA